MQGLGLHAQLKQNPIVDQGTCLGRRNFQGVGGDVCPITDPCDDCMYIIPIHEFTIEIQPLNLVNIRPRPMDPYRTQQLPDAMTRQGQSLRAASSE